VDMSSVACSQQGMFMRVGLQLWVLLLPSVEGATNSAGTHDFYCSLLPAELTSASNPLAHAQLRSSPFSNCSCRHKLLNVPLHVSLLSTLRHPELQSSHEQLRLPWMRAGFGASSIKPISDQAFSHLLLSRSSHRTSWCQCA
jgi:hypothetical protein